VKLGSLALACVLASCTALRVDVADVDAASARAVEPDLCRVVFIVPGIFNDFGSHWCEQVQADLADRGAGVGIVVRYWTTPIGMWLNTGSDEPGRAIAQLAEEIAEQHRRSGCPIELELLGVGFSHGSEVLVDASQRANVHFKRFVLLQSSAFCLSTNARDLLGERVDEIVCVSSWADVATLLFVPLGQGTFGGLGLDNRRITRFHWPWFSRGFRQEVLDWLLPQPCRHTSPSLEYREFLRQLAGRDAELSALPAAASPRRRSRSRPVPRRRARVPRPRGPNWSNGELREAAWGAHVHFADRSQRRAAPAVPPARQLFSRSGDTAPARSFRRRASTRDAAAASRPRAR
jgi:hypothetical protein